MQAADPLFAETEIIPISAISHHLYCTRQNALIHVAGIFTDNVLTVGGNIGHEVVDQERGFADHGVHKETSLRVYSDALGLSGIADIVEFPNSGPPFPIDYKHGRVSSWKNQEAQLCAIAMCLEEMIGANVPCGAIYHIKSRKRHDVVFTEALRLTTLAAVREIRHILVGRILPNVGYSKKCDRCSLRRECVPELGGHEFKEPDDLFEPAALHV